MTSEKIGAIIKAKRRSLEVSQKELAKETGLCNLTIHQIEKGKPSNLKYYLAIFKALNIEFSVN